MSKEFCSRDCKYLNITEEQQNMLGTSQPHICIKYDTRLYHLMAHPELYRCEKCYEEDKE
jgi:hypothetical protein